MVIYVDDLKLSGPKDNLAKGWKLIRSKTDTEEPTAASGTKFLGCMHTSYERDVEDGVNPITGLRTGGDTENPKSTKKVRVRVMEYEMKEFLTSCVDNYCELANTSIDSLKKAPTPFIDVKADEIYDEMEAEDADGNVKRGALQPIATKVLMKLLYAARMLRFDLLKCISLLATRATKWSPI